MEWHFFRISRIILITIILLSSCHKKETLGTLLWRFRTNADVDSSPALGSDGTIYFGSRDSFLYAINTQGSLKWKCKTGDYVESSPTIGPDETIFVGANDNPIYALNGSGTIADAPWPKFRKNLRNTASVR
uniref:Pyrrolo-quinoline quinone repeat domain-containing protein n=1 Tax=candidate division WOR-3 bacterium TaxID=2052148 RepID=A0A7C6A8W2_UNCW3